MSEETMKEKSTERFIQIKDRKLGDEWQGWQGDDGLNTQINARKRIFLGILMSTILGIGAAAFFIWYMISPRLLQFHPALPVLTGLVFLLLWGLISLWFLFMILALLTGKDIFLRLGGREISLTFLIPMALRFGMKLGISKDIIGNSFVKVSNLLIKTTAKRIKPETLLILLPRCLKKSLIQTITGFSKQLHIPVYTVPGGERARELVMQLQPKAIIGVACERDLISGIQDVIARIPVIGIPNIRPEGPCKNTEIDLLEFEKAVQTFLGPEIKINTVSSGL
jgi:hypothetical protein